MCMYAAKLVNVAMMFMPQSGYLSSEVQVSNTCYAFSTFQLPQHIWNLQLPHSQNVRHEGETGKGAQAGEHHEH